MSETKELEVYAGKTALDIFNKDGAEEILDYIRKEATDFTPDTSTDKGRKQIASQSRKVSSSKVIIDDARKLVIADRQDFINKMNEAGKTIRDGCDALRMKSESLLLIGKRLKRTELQRSDMTLK
jgi:hypothetical protein